MSGNVDTLLSCVAICGGYKPGSTETDGWRREFDRLSSERRAVEKRLIMDDRARAALMAADAVILAANAPTDPIRRLLAEVSAVLVGIAIVGDLFDGNGMFSRRDADEAGHD